MINNSIPSGRVPSVMGLNKELCVLGCEDDPIDYDDAKEFIEDIPKLFKNVQGVIFNIFDYQPTGYKSNMEFCEAVREKLDAHQIKYHFESLPKSAASMLLVAANVTVKVQELVSIVFALDESITVMEYEFTTDGYKELAERRVPFDLKENPKLAREKILGSFNPQKIIVNPKENNGCKQMMKFLRAALKSKKLVVLEDINDMREKYEKEMSKWFMDSSYTKFYVLPTCGKNYFLVGILGESNVTLLALDHQEPLPFEKSFYLNHFDAIAYGDASDKASVKMINLENICHQHQITVTIDAQNFLNVKYFQLIFEQINDLPKNLDAKFEKKIPIIGILGHLSVICIPKENGYQFLDGWNGMFGKPLYISFEEPKPKFCENVPHTLEKKASMVYDLIKIMSFPSDKIEVKDIWGFGIVKNDGRPLLIEFDNFNGTRKTASPAFLMALLLKEHIKAVQEETGENPNEIGISLLQEFTEDERKCIVEQLAESCNLLKIDCVFVNA